MPRTTKSLQPLRSTIKAALRTEAPSRPLTFSTKQVVGWIKGKPASRNATPRRVAYILADVAEKAGFEPHVGNLWRRKP